MTVEVMAIQANLPKCWTIPLKAGAEDAGASGFQPGVVETEKGHNSTQTQRAVPKVSAFLHSLGQNFAKDWW